MEEIVLCECGESSCAEEGGDMCTNCGGTCPTLPDPSAESAGDVM